MTRTRVCSYPLHRLFGIHARLIIIPLAGLEGASAVAESGIQGGAGEKASLTKARAEEWDTFTVKLLAALTQATPAAALEYIDAQLLKESRPELLQRKELLRRYTQTANGRADAPRKALNCIVSGGIFTLKQMSCSATVGVPMLVLDGSGRIADMWGAAWPERRLGSFDPVKQERRITAAAYRQAGADHVAQMRSVLTKGELLVFSIANNSAALERLCRLYLKGDRLLPVAERRLHMYLATHRAYERPRQSLLLLSLAIAFTSSVLAILVPEDDASSALYYAVIILPALLVIVDSVDSCTCRAHLEPDSVSDEGEANSALCVCRSLLPRSENAFGVSRGGTCRGHGGAAVVLLQDESRCLR